MEDLEAGGGKMTQATSWENAVLTLLYFLRSASVMTILHGHSTWAGSEVRGQRSEVSGWWGGGRLTLYCRSRKSRASTAERRRGRD